MEEQNKNFIDGVENDESGFDFPSFKDFQRESAANNGSNGYLYGGRQYKKNTAKQYLKMARGEVNNQLGTAAKGLLSKGRDVKKIIQAVKNAARVVAMIGRAVAVLFSPTSWIPLVVVCILLILTTASLAIGDSIKSRKGVRGNSSGTYASAAASSGEVKIAMEELRELYNQKLIISDHPESFYWSQGDPAFQETLNGHWDTCRPQLACAGCALTSISMIFRYFGATGFSSPVDVANYNASINGGDLNIVIDPLVSHYLPDKNVVYHKPGNLTFATIKEQIAKGMPILAGGNKVCGSDGQHWVVIIGLSADENNVIISDPAHDERSSPARYCSKNNMNISKYAIFSDK